MPIFTPPKKYTLLPAGKAIMRITKLVEQGLDPANGCNLYKFELLHEATNFTTIERLSECDKFAWKMNEFAQAFGFAPGLDKGWSFDDDVAAQNEGWIRIDPASLIGLRAAAIIEHRPDSTDPRKVYNQINYPEVAPKLPCHPGTEHLRAKAAPASEAW